MTSILKWANRQTKFSAEFQHVLETGTSKKTDITTLFAALIAMGTNHGLSDMAGRSDMEYNRLKRTTDNFIRPQTLRRANKIIVDITSELPIFSHYNIAQNRLHSSSDGQKFSTRFDTVNARYSPKYFGLGKGVSLNTLVVNHIPVNAKVIGANEHESYFVFDLLFNNPTQIQPAVHSTDTHGSNKVNFAILDFFGYRFAPRYKNFPKETNKLVGFKKTTKYPAQYLIKPSRRINKERIIEQWDNIKRLMASLALKTTSQSVIVKKLSSYNRVNDLQAALTDYNDIIKSIFLLDYLHDRSFRQNIQTALNRGEGFHRLRKNVAYAHDGKLQVHTRREQIIWSECTRLICNVIIYYNSFLLSQLLEKSIEENDAEGIEIIKNISPVAWQHINLHGQYLFNENHPIIDWKVITQKLKIK